ncbi:hypothetical protein G6F57_018466 [Rhizopus arrhizus]|nr:hypothetical protein G6F57_018466 [Rhizopus arrhizus]
MAALEQNGTGTEVEQGGGGLLGIVTIADVPPDQQLCFRCVRGDQRGKGNQALTHRLQGAVFQQACATGGDHHRVQHHVRWAMALQCVGNDVDHLGVGQHAELHRVDIEIIETGLQLRTQEVARRHVHGGHAAGVLCGQRGDRRQAMHAMCGERLQVGLDSSTTAGVGAGDGEGGYGSGRAHPAIVPWSRWGR